MGFAVKIQKKEKSKFFGCSGWKEFLNIPVIIVCQTAINFIVSQSKWLTNVAPANENVKLKEVACINASLNIFPMWFIQFRLKYLLKIILWILQHRRI